VSLWQRQTIREMLSTSQTKIAGSARCRCRDKKRGMLEPRALPEARNPKHQIRNKLETPMTGIPDTDHPGSQGLRPPIPQSHNPAIRRLRDSFRVSPALSSVEGSFEFRICQRGRGLR
jgi:hypothetical protein